MNIAYGNVIQKLTRPSPDKTICDEPCDYKRGYVCMRPGGPDWIGEAPGLWQERPGVFWSRGRCRLAEARLTVVRR